MDDAELVRRLRSVNDATAPYANGTALAWC